MAFGLLCFDKDGSINRGELQVARKRHRCLSQKKSSLPPQDFSDEDLREIRLQTMSGPRERNFRRENNAVLQISLRSGSLAKLGNFAKAAWSVFTGRRPQFFCCSAC
jgi:hypothetical protein